MDILLTIVVACVIVICLCVPDSNGESTAEKIGENVSWIIGK